MKLILTGANGFIGLEVLSRALSHPSVTSVITLTRKPLPAPYDSNPSPKLHPIITEDFISYPPSILSQLSGADACIWLLGAKSTDLELGRKLRIDYTMAAARTFAKLARDEGRKFRFVFVSGIVTVRDPNSTVWLFPEVRKLGGQAETEILTFAEENTNDFESFVARPAFVAPKESTLINNIRNILPYSIKVDNLASVLIDIAENGAKEKIFEHSNLNNRAKDLARK